MDLYRYECGEISDDAFIENLRGLLEDPVDAGELTRIWLHVFSPIYEMQDLANQLMADFGVYLLSNASTLHWEHLRRDYGLDTLGRDRLTSFEVGVRKPDPEIYAAAESRFRIRPETTVFIDDQENNVIGARACGWTAFQHKDIRTTREMLRALNVIAE